MVLDSQQTEFGIFSIRVLVTVGGAHAQFYKNVVQFGRI